MLLYEDKKNSVSAILRTGLTCMPHLHSHIEAGYVVKGNTVVTIDGISYTVNEGEAFIIFPNRIHAYEDDGNIKCYLLICSPDDTAPFNDVFKGYLPVSPVFKPAEPEILHSVFDFAAKRGFELERDPDTPFTAERVKAYAPAVVAEMLGGLQLKPTTTGDPDATQRILLYCDTNYKEDLSLDVLSRELGYSRYYISHVFTQNVKMGFSRYLRSLRINAAKRLIRHSNMSMTEIAIDSGFASIRTFNRQFFAETGVTPTEYAKKRRNE